MKTYRVTGISARAAITTVQYVRAVSALAAIDDAAKRPDGKSVQYHADAVS